MSQTAVVQLPDGRKAQIQFDSPDQLDAAVNDLVAHSQQQPNAWDQIKHSAGLTARAVAQGATDLLNLPGDIGTSLLNFSDAHRDPYQVTMDDGSKQMRGGQYSVPIPSSSQSTDAMLTQAGLPQPQTPGEQLSSNIQRRLTGAATTMGLGTLISGAPGIVGPIGQTLAANPVVQGMSAVTGPTAADLTRRAGGGQGAQYAADVIGTMAPGAVAYAAPESVRQGFRGGEQGRQAVQNNIDTFQAAGTTPSAGQATQGRFAQATESLLSKTPGSAGQMSAKSSNQAGEIGASLEAQASKLSPQASGEQAGRAITKGISGEGGFVEKFKAKQGELYDQLDSFIPANKPVAVDNTRNALKSLNADIPGAPNVSKFFKNAKIGGIQSAVEADATQGTKPVEDMIAQAADGTLPYEAVKKLRTLVGNEMADSWAGSDVPRSKWKTLYGALTSDLKSAAEQTGPEASAAWNRANNFTRAGMSRIDVLSNVIEKNGGPEKVFQAATSGTKEGATTLRAVMQSLPQDAQKTLTATVLRRLGQAKAGVQNDTGSQFSTESFLTNWNNLSPESKRVLFDRFGPQFRQNMDQVASVASNLRTGSKVFVNPSGTGQAAAQYTTVGAFAMAALTGRVGTASAIAGGAGIANLSARLMTNPNFVKWLATATKAPIGAKAALINQLAKGDEDMKALAQSLNQEQQDQQQTNQRQQ
jgi:hypothetical protein